MSNNADGAAGLIIDTGAEQFRRNNRKYKETEMITIRQSARAATAQMSYDALPMLLNFKEIPQF